jgi:hypothetical protein
MGWQIFLPTSLPTHSQNNHQKTENTKIYTGFVDYLKKKTENTKIYNGFVVYLKKKTENTKIYNGFVVFKLPNHYIYKLFQAFWINKPTKPKASHSFLSKKLELAYKYSTPRHIPDAILIQN